MDKPVIMILGIWRVSECKRSCGEDRLIGILSTVDSAGLPPRWLKRSNDLLEAVFVFDKIHSVSVPGKQMAAPAETEMSQGAIPFTFSL